MLNELAVVGYQWHNCEGDSPSILSGKTWPQQPRNVGVCVDTKYQEQALHTGGKYILYFLV